MTSHLVPTLYSRQKPPPSVNFTLPVPGKLFPTSVDNTSVVHVTDLAVLDDVPPEGMVPVFTLPKITNRRGPLQPLGPDDNADEDAMRQYMALRPEDQRGLIPIVDEEDTFHGVYSSDKGLTISLGETKDIILS